MALKRRTRMIGGQFEHQWCTCQPLFPIGKLVIQEFALHLFVLPEGRIYILKRQVSEWGRLSMNMGSIECTQFVQEDSEGPSIRDNVVHGDHQTILLRLKLTQAETQQRTLGQ